MLQAVIICSVTAAYDSDNIKNASEILSDHMKQKHENRKMLIALLQYGKMNVIKYFKNR
jgi:hypothetical protein